MDNEPGREDDRRRHVEDAPSDLGGMVRIYEQPLRRFFSKRSYDRNEVEDLVQEVFVRLAARGNIDNLQNPEGYLFLIATNLLRDRARRDFARRAATDELAQRTGNNFEDISPERILQGREDVVRLHRALNELPERTRGIFVLHRFEELKYSEIAQRLNISVSLVEKHMMDAIAHVTLRFGRS